MYIREYSIMSAVCSYIVCRHTVYIFFKVYRKIPKISPGANFFQRPFLRGLYLERLIYGGKFAFRNRFG